MTSHLEQLQAALSAWDDDREVDRSPETLALNVLELAEQALDEPADRPGHQSTWHRFLDSTRRSPFLMALQDPSRRERWAEACFRAIHTSNYTFGTMLEQRVARHPERPLLRHADAPPGSTWSYAQVHSQSRRFAATLLQNTPTTPHVALWLANSIHGAICDIACLAHDIPNTPISTRADHEELATIHRAFPFDVAITDSQDRYTSLVALRRTAGRPFRILRLDSTSEPLQTGDDHLLRANADLGAEEIEATLARRARLGLDDSATVMFTPGPSGHLKGVVFSIFNLMTKRFARAAALPRLGEEELLLCYLPLFHTFGRFLELMGAAFWGATYVFASDPSIESLLSGLRKVRPTSLVSIPVRWDQVHRRILDVAGPGADERLFEQACARVTGGRLRWGLSAAGYLDPGVFRFFHRMGIALCSGFGMTEATGGVTMTPPDDYADGSVGIPLPGMRTRLSDASELLIAGPYVARMLGDPPSRDDLRWTPTGDLFRVRDDGHYEIFDKIKDIYKNTHGQTIAPKRIEGRFEHTPGIQHVMLVGDGKDDSTILLFVDPSVPGLRGLDSDAMREHFKPLVLEINRGLAPHERVVDLRVITDSLDESSGALLADGSLHRKTVLARHRTEVDAMYASSAAVFALGNLTVRVPRWLLRELCIFIDDLAAEGTRLVNRASGASLRVEVRPDGIRLGDLVYEVSDGAIDMGRVTRQPALWIGNAALTEFFPCKEGWDVVVKNIGPAPRLPVGDLTELADVRPLPPGHDESLRDAHRWTVLAFARDGAVSAGAVERLGGLLARGQTRLDQVIRRRLQALACHPQASVRSRAFRALLVDGNDVDGLPLTLPFLSSGRSFMSEDALAYVMSHRAERRPMETLSKALRACRAHLGGPVTPAMRDQLEQVFEHIVRVSRRDLGWWTAARQELAAWTLPGVPDELARLADACLGRLHRPQSADPSRDTVPVGWQEDPIVTPELGAHPSDEQLQDAVTDHNFLAKSAAVLSESSARAFIESTDLVVTREPAPSLSAVRVGWTSRRAHADMVLTALREDVDAELSARWRLALRGAPSPWPLVPAMGLWHERFDVVSTELVDAPTVWERLRALASRGGLEENRERLRALFVRGMAACLRVWDATGRGRIGRGAGPANVLIHMPDEAEHGCVRELDLEGEPTPFAGVVDLLAREFYERTSRHYPWCSDRLDPNWLFDACVEALGVEQADAVLEGYVKEAGNGPWHAAAKRYADSNAARGAFPLAARSVVLGFRAWLDRNGGASTQAKAQTVAALTRHHGLERFPDVVRFRVVRDTVFSTGPSRTVDTFDALIEAMMCRDCDALGLVQFVELQNAVKEQELREVLRQLVFPEARPLSRPSPHARPQRAKGSLSITDARGSVYALRFSQEARDISAVLHQAWNQGCVRSFWSDEVAVAAWDDRERPVGGLLLRRGGRGDFGFDGPYIAAHLQGNGLDHAVVEAVVQHAAGRAAPALRSVRRHPLRHGKAWNTERDWGGYVKS